MNLQKVQGLGPENLLEVCFLKGKFFRILFPDYNVSAKMKIFRFVVPPYVFVIFLIYFMIDFQFVVFFL